MSPLNGKGSGLAPSSLASARAMIEESVLARWQLWHTWLTLSAERLELQEQQSGEDAAFDLDEAHGVARLREIEAQLAAIPSAARAEFQSVYDIKRAEVADRLERAPQATRGRTGGVDVFEIERIAYRELIATCQGDPAQGKRGEVPLDGEWYEVDTRALRQVPGAERFALGRPSRRTNWTNVAVALGLVALVGLFIAIQPRQGRAATAEASGPAVMVENVAVTPWRPVALAFVEPALVEGDAPVEIPIATAAHGTWPALPPSEGAAWREGTVWPIELCLPRDMLRPDAVGLRLLSAGDAPARDYRLSSSPGGPGPSSLILRDCGGDQSLTRYGVVEAAAPLPAAVPGETLSLPGGPAITLESFQVVGPSQDDLLPTGRVRVQVVATGDGVRDWSALRPTLLLASGEAAALSASPESGDDGRTVLTYLVGGFETPLSVAWQVSDLATGRMARWRSTLPPPPTRLTYLDEVLQVGDLEANLIQPGQVRLTVPLHNRGARPLTIRYDDISVRQGSEPVSVPAFGQEAGTVAAGASTELTLDIVPPRPDAPVLVTVGRSVFEVQLAEWR